MTLAAAGLVASVGGLGDIEFSGYLTEANLRLVVLGAGGAVLAVALLGLLRRSPGWLVGVVAPGLGLFAAGSLDWPDPTVEWLASAVVVGLLAGHGYEQVRSSPPVAPLLLLATVGGVWLAVPENNPALVVAGGVVGLALAGRVTDPGVGWGLATAAAWPVLLGARPFGWSFVGGLLCLSPLVAVGLRSWVRGVRGWLPAWPWLVIGGGAVSSAAARWVGVAPDATWTRVGVIAVLAGVVAVVWRR